MRRGITSFLALGVAFVAMCAPASATFHLIKVYEVFPGTVADPNANFVVLRSVAPGQTHVNTHSLKITNAAGTTTQNVTFTSDVTNGETGRNLLIATTEAQTLFNNVSADLTMPSTTDLISPAGGKICWDANLDCVTWGNFVNQNDPDAGTPGPVIPDGDGLVRRLNQAGCGLTLDAGDDTDDSGTDLVQTGLPAALNNAFPVAACANTTVTKKPKSKTTDRTPTVKFKTTPSGTDTTCKVDDGNYKPCESPFTTKHLKLGKHTIRIKASSTPDNTDPSPAKVSFKVVKKPRHHHG